MADGISGNALADRARGTRQPQRYGTNIVVGGGCYGSYHVRQLWRAVQRVAECGARGPVEVLIATVSHCHGALTVLAGSD